MRHVIGDTRTYDKAFVDLLNRSAIRAMRKDSHASSMLIALAEAVRVKLVNEGATFDDVLRAVQNAPIAPRDPEPIEDVPTPTFTRLQRERQDQRGWRKIWPWRS